jgi:hypothetical protein
MFFLYLIFLTLSIISLKSITNIPALDLIAKPMLKAPKLLILYSIGVSKKEKERKKKTELRALKGRRK